MLPELDLLVVETEEIVPPRILDRRMERREALHEDLALDVAPAGAPADLGEELEGPFARPEVRDVQRHVGVDDPDEGDIREVEPFRDHLRADQDVGLAHAEVGEDPTEIVLPLERVGIHPLDASLGEELRQGVLDALGAHARKTDRRVAALGLRALRRHPLLVPADMAHEPLRGPMEGQRDAAVRTTGHETAFLALQRGRVAAAVEEEHRLLAPFETLGDRLLERFGEDRRRALAAELLLPHVDHAHDRQLHLRRPVRHLQQRVLPSLRVVVALERGRRAAEHDHRAFALAADDRDVPRVVPRGLLLLVRMLVLLVDDDEPERVHRREDRRPRADDDLGPALPDLVPLVMPFAAAEMRMQHRHQGLLRPR